MESGGWKVVDGKWWMESGGWKVVDGKWWMESGGWSITDGDLHSRWVQTAENLVA